MIKPFNIEMFYNVGDSITDSLSEHELTVINNFEKIVQEKYIDRVYSVSAPMFVFEDETHTVKSHVAPSIEAAITIFMEILITTDQKLFCMNYVKGIINRVRFETV